MADCTTNSKFLIDSQKYFNNLLHSSEVFPASYLLLEKYKPFQKSQATIRNKKVLQKPKQSEDDELKELNTNKMISRYKTFIDKKVNKQNFVKRRKNYIEAKKILNKIAGIKSISITSFYPLYASLVGGSGYEQMWHSGGINRGINKVKKHPQKFQKLVKYIKQNHNKPVEEVFENAMKNANQIPKLGINIITEILATYNPQKFAIVNNSPIGALRYFGVYVKNKPAFGGLYYGTFLQMDV